MRKEENPAQKRDQLNRCKNLLKTPPAVDRKRQPPQCLSCMYFQPKFRFRCCLYVRCPYGKGCTCREEPLKREYFGARRAVRLSV